MNTNTPFQVGITGGIGAGKSLICKLFQLLGIPIYDADSRAKWLMSNDAGLKKAIQQAFGKESYDAEGALNRRYLANQVFAKGEEQVKRLNSLVHPRVGEDSQEWAKEQLGKAPYVLREAALLFESGGYKQMQRNITVFAPIDLRVARVRQRDPQRSEEEVRQIIGKQWSEEQRQQLADYTLYNDESQMLIPQVLTLHEQLITLATTDDTRA